MKNEIDEYIEWKKMYTEYAWKSYKVWIRRLQNFTHKPIEEIGIGDLQRFIEIQKLNFAPKNIEYGMNIIHNFFTFWRARGKTCLDPGLIRVPRARGVARSHTTEEMYQRIVEMLPINEFVSLRDNIITRILHDTGCRISEALSIDFKNLDDYSALVPTRKTKEWRTIFWSEETRKLLFEKYIPIRICFEDKTDALFISKYGESSRGRLTNRTYQRNLKNVCNELGLKGITPHSFRHGKAHAMVAQDASISDIAHILGHRNIQSSMKYLSLSVEEMFRRARKYLV
jgi:site-specific recombinase XerD